MKLSKTYDYIFIQTLFNKINTTENFHNGIYHATHNNGKNSTIVSTTITKKKPFFSFTVIWIFQYASLKLKILKPLNIIILFHYSEFLYEVCRIHILIEGKKLEIISNAIINVSMKNIVNSNQCYIFLTIFDYMHPRRFH